MCYDNTAVIYNQEATWGKHHGFSTFLLLTASFNLVTRRIIFLLVSLQLIESGARGGVLYCSSVYEQEVVRVVPELQACRSPVQTHISALLTL